MASVCTSAADSRIQSFALSFFQSTHQLTAWDVASGPNASTSRTQRGNSSQL